MEETEANINKVVEEVWQKYDVDGNGVLDILESKKFINEVILQQEGGQEMIDTIIDESVYKMTMAKIDSNQNGVIEKEELKAFIKGLIQGTTQ